MIRLKSKEEIGRKKKFAIKIRFKNGIKNFYSFRQPEDYLKHNLEISFNYGEILMLPSAWMLIRFIYSSWIMFVEHFNVAINDAQANPCLQWIVRQNVINLLPHVENEFFISFEIHRRIKWNVKVHVLSFIHGAFCTSYWHAKGENPFHQFSISQNQCRTMRKAQVSSSFSWLHEFVRRRHALLSIQLRSLYIKNPEHLRIIINYSWYYLSACLFTIFLGCRFDPMK